MPAFGDVGYAQGPGNLSSYLIALAGGPQATGGLFSLTAPLNFGPNFGLIAVNYTTATANPATAGQIRLAKTDTIDWRNNANSANLPLGINGSDQLTFNGAVISAAGSTALTNTHIFVGNAANIATDVALSGDATLANTGALTLNTVNANVGSFTAANITVNAKGLITAAASGSAGVSSVTGTANQITSTGGTTPVVALANPLVTPGPVTITGNLTFTPTTAGIVGTTTNDSTAAGNVGEYFTSPVGPTNFPATGVYGDLTSRSLTAGDWDVTGTLMMNGGTINQSISVGISTTAGNSTTGLVNGDNWAQTVVPETSGTINAFYSIPNVRFSLATTTTIYLKYQATYTGTTPAAFGRLSARRVR